MKKLAVIANRSAGKGKALQALQDAKRSLWGWEVDYLFPTSIEDLKSTCSSLDPHTYEAAILIGGDGTVNQALPALCESKVPFCPFPGGTANDLAAELGIEPKWDQIQNLIDQKQTTMMDLITVNGRPFATVAGIGIGALLTSEFNERRNQSWLFREISRRLQSQVYTALTAKTILTRRDYFHNLRIKSDTFTESLKTAAVFICNQSFLGGDLKVAPTISNTDKRFNVLIIPRSKIFSLMKGLAEIKMGKLPRNFIVFSTDRLFIREERGKKLRVFGDGEILTESNELDFRVAPAQVRVYREGNA
jgi:diacylglycerol kinase family enzyme